MVAPVHALSHSPVRCSIMLLDGQSNKPPMACLTPMYRTQCSLNSSTTVLCKIRNVRNRFSTKFAVHAAQLPNSKCYVHSPPVNVSRSTYQISVEVCNESNKPLLLAPHLVVAKLSLDKTQSYINTVMSFSSAANHAAQRGHAPNFSNWAQERLAQHTREQAQTQYAAPKTFTNRSARNVEKKEEDDEHVGQDVALDGQGQDAADGGLKDRGPSTMA